MDITPGMEKTTPSHMHARAYNEGFKHWVEALHIQFPKFKHEHPPVIDVNKIADERMTTGQKIADGVASTVGSWPFIIIQSIILAAWIALNVIAIIGRWDPYPFILLNLALSFQAAYAAPFVMMSQNRQAAKDRLMAESDYHCNVKGEEEIRNIMEHLEHQDEVILRILKHMEAHHKEMMVQLSRLDSETASQLGIDIQQIKEEMTETFEDIGGNS